MNKASRVLIGVVVVVGILVVGGYLALTHLNRLVKGGVETAGPQLTGTPVTLGAAEVSVFSGEGALRQLRIANPEGFTAPHAFDMGAIELVVDSSSLTTDVIHIRSLVIDGPQLVAEFADDGRNNLKVILDHIRSLSSGDDAADDSGAGDGGGAETRVIIDSFRFINARVRALAPVLGLDESLEIPAVELSHIGVDQGGAALADVAEQLLVPIAAEAMSAARKRYLAARAKHLTDTLKDEAQGLIDKILK